MRLCAIFFFCCYLQSICSQPLQSGKVITNYTYKHFSIADGLPQIQITHLYCDSKGFIWVGTKFGVARWDGKQFKVFTPKEGAAGKQVVMITELTDGSIAVAWQSNAVNIIKGDAIETVELPKHWNAVSVSGIYKHTRDKIFMYVSAFSDAKTYKRSVVSIYNIRTKKFEKETWLRQWWVVDVKEDGSIITANLSETMEGANEFYLYKYNRFVSSLRFPFRFNGLNLSRYPHTRFFKENEQNKLYELKCNDNKLQVAALPTFIKQPVTLNGNKFYLDAPGKKSYYTNASQQLVVNESGNETVVATLPTCHYKLLDKEGNLWVATENGLYCFYQLAMQEIQFNTQPGTTDAVWSMTKTKGGAYFYSSYDKGFWVSRDHNQSWQRITALQGTQHSEWMQNGAYGTKALSNGAVILAARGGFHYSKNGFLKSWNLFGKGAEMFASWEDTVNQKLLISKHSYLFSLDLKTLQLDTVFKTPQLGLNTILHITGDAGNNPIISGNGSSCIFKNKQWQRVTGAEGLNAISSCVDSWDGLWLGHIQKLTLIKDGKPFEMKHFPGRQLVLSLATWKRKWLVVGGGFEIIFLDLETFYKTGKEIYQRFDRGCGFITTEGGQNSFVHENDGSIWWPCQDKVIRFWPEKLLSTATISTAPVIFSAFATNTQYSSIALDDPLHKGIQKVNASFRNLQFKFGSAVMNNYDNLVYRYRLKGLDTNWSKPAANGNAVFSNLKPGTYLFEVQSSTDAFSWSGAASTLPVTLQAWWYETLLFKVIAVLSGIGVVSFITWWLMQRKRKETERSKLINELQLKAIRSKALPHFSGNAFANIDFYIEKGDTENASRYLAVLSRLHNITLVDSDKSARTLEEELNYVRLYLEMEKLRFEEHLNYSIAVGENVNTQILVPNMLLHTFTENAIKHGIKNKRAPGILTIKAVVKDQGVLLSVSDNGIGRAASKQANAASTRQGLEILGRQIELYNQQNKNKITQTVTDLTDESGVVTGTCFSVFIPDEYRYEV